MSSIATSGVRPDRNFKYWLIGPAVFLLVGLGGMAFGAAFLAYPESIAKPLIIGIEIAMTLTVAVTLGLLVSGAPERVDRQ